MSTVAANLLQNTAGTNRPNVTGGEFVAQRFNLNGTGTIAPRDDFGIASYVDNGVGDYTANFGTAYPNANWSAVGTSGDVAGTVNGTFSYLRGATTTSWRAQWFNIAGSLVDPPYLGVQFVGDAP